MTDRVTYSRPRRSSSRYFVRAFIAWMISS